MEIKALGIDLAKRVFQLHGVDAKGKIVLKIKVGQGGIIKLHCKFASLPYRDGSL